MPRWSLDSSCNGYLSFHKDILMYIHSRWLLWREICFLPFFNPSNWQKYDKLKVQLKLLLSTLTVKYGMITCACYQCAIVVFFITSHCYTTCLPDPPEFETIAQPNGGTEASRPSDLSIIQETITSQGKKKPSRFFPLERWPCSRGYGFKCRLPHIIERHQPNHSRRRVLHENRKKNKDVDTVLVVNSPEGKATYYSGDEERWLWVCGGDGLGGCGCLMLMGVWWRGGSTMWVC